MEVCCGGLVGMGETLEQRAELAAQLAALDPDEVPLNFLNPRPGTPFGDLPSSMAAQDALRTIAAFRLALPRTILRYAGGRELTLGDLGTRQGLLGGINAVIVGNYLTTLGRDPQEDLDLLAELSMPVKALSEDAVSRRGDGARGRRERLRRAHARAGCTSAARASRSTRRASARRAGASSRSRCCPTGYRGAKCVRCPTSIDAARCTASCATIESAQGPKVTLDGREVLLLCSNDYLGLAGDQRVRDAAARRRRSAGARAPGASPLVSGHMGIHRELEQRLAELKGTEACVLFGSGFLANTGVIAALATDGVVASRRAQPRLDRRRLPARARADARLPARRGPGRRRRDRHRRGLLDGRRRRAAGRARRDRRARDRRRGARDGRDRARRAAGSCTSSGSAERRRSPSGRWARRSAPTARSSAATRATADFLVNRARTMIYSTALPPPSVGAALKALELMDRRLVARLHANARTLRGALGVEVNDMPIVPLVVRRARGRRWRAARPRSSRASSPRRSARRRCPRARRGCGSWPPRRTIRRPARCMRTL